VTWTSAKPTVPGWYWFCVPARSPRKWVVEIGVFDGKPYDMSHDPDTEGDATDEVAGEWAGPIPEPTEATR
jgi:hypothetical protein